MKVLLPFQKTLENSFEQELQKTLEKLDLPGYALLGFSFANAQGKLHEIDATLILFPGIFICLEAKNYAGLWTGSPNEVWKCDGQEIKAIGTNPYLQARRYAFVIKERLDFLFCPYGVESKIFVNHFVVAPDQAQFKIPRATVNQFEYGSRIIICNLSSLEKTIAGIVANYEVQEIVKVIGLETIVRYLTNLSEDTILDELVTVSTDNKDTKKLPQKPLKRTILQNREDTPNLLNQKTQTLKNDRFVGRVSPEHQHPKRKHSKFTKLLLLIIKGSLFLTLIMIIVLPLLQYFLKTPITKNTIVIGSVSSEEGYQPLQDYLDQKLIPSNIFHFLSGEDIIVTLQASQRNRPNQYPEAIGKIRNYQWDIVFSYSPVIAIEAENSGYQFVARMFPYASGYQSTFFVRENSKINFDQLSSNYTIALGDFFSASRFYMPIYDLYGSSLNVITNLSPQTIENFVKMGKADIGVGVLNQTLPKGLKILKTSRNLPGTGVYLSPKLSPRDFRKVRQLLLNAPQPIKTQANYDAGTPPDYQNFRKIVSRVREISACSNFEKNPVVFTCGDQIITTIEGEITTVEISGQWQELTITQSTQKPNSVCKVSVRDTILKIAIDYNSVFDLQGRKVRFYVGYPKGETCSPLRPKLIYQPNQIEILNLHSAG